jgi:putative nucleotidyltransferase with HDIG domain
MNKILPKVAGYISSDRQNSQEREFDLELQKKRIENCCRKNNFELVKIYKEPFSSKPDYKPVLALLFSESKQKMFEKLLIEKTDRLHNDKTLCKGIISEIKKNNIEIISLNDPDSINETPLPDLEKAKIKTKNIRQKVRDIPSLPEVVTKVMEIIQNQQSSAAELSVVISRDPGLTSRVLRLVNSAYYGFPKQISSIQHAVMILGFTTMRGLVLSSSIFKIFTPKGAYDRSMDYRKLWKHSLLTAIAAKRVCQYLYFAEEDDLFSGAILHDIGKIILDQYDHENYSQVIYQLKGDVFSPSLINFERKYCDVDHQEIGYSVMEGWNLPGSLSNVIRYHHQPLKCEANKKLVSIVYVANILSQILLSKKELNFHLFDYGVLEYLALSEQDLISINESMAEEIDNIGDFEAFLN